MRKRGAGEGRGKEGGREGDTNLQMNKMIKFYIHLTKDIMQGKFIAVAYILKPFLSGRNL